VCRIHALNYAGLALGSKPGNSLAVLGRLYLDIAMWRRGPADVPGVPLLLWLTVCAYVGVIALLSAALQLRSGWPRELAFDVLYTLVWCWLLLWSTRRRERFVQTAAAVFGFQLVLAPLMIGIGALVPAEPTGDGLLALQIATLLVIGWVVLAVAHIVKSALDWSLMACVPLSMFLFLAEQLLLQSLL
jgi:hypothetical protein